MLKLAILAAALLLLAVTYRQYLTGRLRQATGLTVIALLAFVSVLLATALVVPFTAEYLPLQLLAAVVGATGAAVGARKARSIAAFGLKAYEERRSQKQHRRDA